MRALVITEHGPPEVLRVIDQPDPQPGPGQVRIAVKAAGINFADLMARVGLYADAPKPPCVVGYEVAGEIESLGAGVEGFSVGQRVMAPTKFGGYAELAVTPAADLVPLPDDWSFEQGAAVPVVYATAYAGVVRYGAVHKGEKLLVQAAAGGVGIAATQIGKHFGAEVFGTASGSKLDAIRGFGVDHPIDYRTKDFAKEIRRITGEKEPLDLIIDGIGGASFKKGYRLLRPGGRIVMIGASAVMEGERRNIPRALRTVLSMPRFNPLTMMSSSRAAIGLNMLHIWQDKGSMMGEYGQPLSELIAAGTIKPVVAEAFPLERGADAHRFVAERKNIGKVVLTV
ncbi:MAG TPA: medium chain dehydrogenase/reductase family protein [Thermoleophilaceae bacterium]|jgi:NADPH:quinone reductase-like Zn-dependent oxidoreductase